MVRSAAVPLVDAPEEGEFTAAGPLVDGMGTVDSAEELGDALGGGVGCEGAGVIDAVIAGASSAGLAPSPD